MKIVGALFFVFIFVFAFGVTARDDPYFYGLHCDDTGAVRFHRNPAGSILEARHLGGGSRFNVTGFWKGDDFTSDEGIFTKPGRYQINDPVNGHEQFECPGLRFSCRFARLEVQDCYTLNRTTFVDFIVFNASPSDLEFSFTEQSGGGRRLVYSGNYFSPKLENSSFVSVGSHGGNRLRVPHTNFTSVAITHPLCVGRYYIRQELECGEGRFHNFTDSNFLEPPTERLECDPRHLYGSILCYLDGNKSDRGDLIPQECSGQQVQTCRESYGAVSACFDAPNTSLRSECFLRSLGIVSLEQEKQHCEDEVSPSACVSYLRSRVYTYAKLEIHALEYDTVVLYDRGMINKSNAASIIYNLELAKKAFDLETDTQNRRLIINKVADEWRRIQEEVGS